jgi:hypothetical protein
VFLSFANQSSFLKSSIERDRPLLLLFASANPRRIIQSGLHRRTTHQNHSLSLFRRMLATEQFASCFEFPFTKETPDLYQLAGCYYCTTERKVELRKKPEAREQGTRMQGTAKQSGTYTKQEESCHRKRAQNNNKKDVQAGRKKARSERVVHLEERRGCRKEMMIRL